MILGAGGHATSVANVALSAGYTLHGFVDPARAGATLLGRPVVAALEGLAGYDLAIAAGDNAVRERIWRELTAQYDGLRFPALVHASAVVSVGTTLGEGTVLMPGAVAGPNAALGRFCLLNTRAAIDHDCRLADFASLAPGAITGGNVTIGTRSAVGIGAVVKHGLGIGDDAVLGANSYLHRDLPALVVAYGSPARVVRARAKGERYLG